MGEGEPRQVVSGLVKFMSEADMRGRLVVVVANMKPANMRGVKSHAMVLCASAADGSKVFVAFMCTPLVPPIAFVSVN